MNALQACQDIVLAFMAHFDERDGPAMEACVLPQLEWQRPDRVIHGTAELREVLAATPADVRVRHVITNLRAVSHDDGRVVVDSYFTVYRFTGPLAADTPAPLDGPASMGRYRDELVETDGRWKLARKQTFVDFRRA
jgi:3-phenylpropionate/cinnamic acid dioxygenase small subunit